MVMTVSPLDPTTYITKRIIGMVILLNSKKNFYLNF